MILSKLWVVRSFGCLPSKLKEFFFFNLGFNFLGLSPSLSLATSEKRCLKLFTCSYLCSPLVFHVWPRLFLIHLLISQIPAKCSYIKCLLNYIKKFQLSVKNVRQRIALCDVYIDVNIKLVVRILRPKGNLEVPNLFSLTGKKCY